MAEKCKGFAETLLETIEIQKRKLADVYEYNDEACQKQQKKYIAEDFAFIESSTEPGKSKSESFSIVLQFSNKRSGTIEKQVVLQIVC